VFPPFCLSQDNDEHEVNPLAHVKNKCKGSAEKLSGHEYKLEPELRRELDQILPKARGNFQVNCSGGLAQTDSLRYEHKLSRCSEIFRFAHLTLLPLMKSEIYQVSPICSLRR
jgi:hypothetical protein